jgi:hypothetical protein
VVSVCGGLGRVTTRWGNLRALVPLILLLCTQNRRSPPNPTHEQVYDHVVVPLISAIESSAQALAHAAVQSHFLSVMQLFLWSAGAGTDKRHLSDQELARLTDLVRATLSRVEEELTMRRENDSLLHSIAPDIPEMFGVSTTVDQPPPPAALMFSLKGVSSSRTTTTLSESEGSKFAPSVAASFANGRHHVSSFRGHRSVPNSERPDLDWRIDNSSNAANEASSHRSVVQTDHRRCDEQRELSEWPAWSCASDRRKSLAVASVSASPPPLPPRRQSIGMSSTSLFSRRETSYFSSASGTNRSQQTIFASSSNPSPFLAEARSHFLDNDDSPSPPRRRARIANTPKKQSGPTVSNWDPPAAPLLVSSPQSCEDGSDANSCDGVQNEQISNDYRAPNTNSRRARRRISLAVFGRRLHASQNEPTFADNKVDLETRHSSSVPATRRASLSRGLESGRMLRYKMFRVGTSVENI